MPLIANAAKNAQPIFGVRADAPRPTRVGALLAAMLIGPPLLAFLLACDLIVGAIVFAAFGVDVTLWALF